ncbi:MAG: hypothetical protein IPJ01_10375 [Micavibrio sp.]|nr:hypothetical protein [Micavibrio sp.]
MNKQQAIQAMLEGKKVTHLYFSNDEWVTMVNGQIVLEDGVKCSPLEFWRWRTDEMWETDWSIYEEKK